jgi:hypothetical protein
VRHSPLPLFAFHFPSPPNQGPFSLGVTIHISKFLRALCILISLTFLVAGILHLRFVKMDQSWLGVMIPLGKLLTHPTALASMSLLPAIDMG